MNIRSYIEKILRYIHLPAGGLFQAVVELPEFKPLTEGLSAGPPLLVRALESGNMTDFLTAIFNIAISVGAILAVLRIAYGGFVYMTTDAVGQKTNAKEIIQNAVVGLLLLLAVVLILERINPDILKINIDLRQSSSTGSPLPGGGAFPRL